VGSANDRRREQTRTKLQALQRTPFWATNCALPSLYRYPNPILELEMAVTIQNGRFSGRFQEMAVTI
jgi:hypothetical protein